MRKIFSIFSAVLVSLALQATRFKANLDLSVLSNNDAEVATYDADTKVITPKQAWAGVGHWYGSYDVSQYTQIVIKLANACSQPVQLSISHEGGEIADQAIIVPAGSTMGRLDLNSPSISNIWIALYSTSIANIELDSIYLEGTYGDEEVIPLNSTETSIENYNTGVGAASDLFANVHAGDQVIVNFEHKEGGEYDSQVNITINGEALDYYGGAKSFGATTKQVRVTLTATDVAKAKLHGIYVNGYYVTIKSVQLRKFSTLLTEETTLDWTGQLYEASLFSGLTVGDVLYAKVSEIGELDSYPQLYFDANWTSFAPATHYFFNDQTPKTVSYTVTESMLSLIQSEGLRVRGSGCKITDVYTKKATAVRVSYDLTVTAGMATLVLPFKVQSLPSGVEAYTLTLRESDHAIMAEQVNVIEADQPVLIVAEARETPYTFVSEEGGDDNISGKSWSSKDAYAYGVLVGNYRPTHDPGQTHTESAVT